MPIVDTSPPVPVTGDRARGPRTTVPRRRAARIVAALTGAWLLPVATHLLRLDVLLIPIIVIAVAALVRGGRTVIDQLVLGLAILFGATCLAGLLFSVWPVHLHPVPAAGTALTAVVLVAAGSGRRPAPAGGRPRTPDLWMVAASLCFAALTAYPFLNRNLAGRLGLLAPGEDIARHFVLYDVIRRVGGYGFLHQRAAARSVEDGSGLPVYPQGWHFTCALLHNFWDSTTVVGDGASAMSWFVGAYVATFVCFGWAVLWSVRRLGGPLLTGLSSIVVFGAATAYLYFGDPVTIMLRGFPNELAGLALLAITVAVAARPLPGTAEQTILLAALLVGIAFTYYLFTPIALVAVFAWAVPSRRRLRRRRVIAVTATVLVVAATAIPVLLNGRANTGDQLLLPGNATRVDRTLLLALIFLVLAGMVAGGWSRRGGPRSPATLVQVTATGAAALVAVAIGGYQLRHAGTTFYYTEKAYHGLAVVALTGLGAVIRLWPGRWPLRAPWRTELPLSLLLVASVGVAGLSVGRSAAARPGLALLTGRVGIAPAGPADAIVMARRFPGGAGAVTVNLAHGPWAAFFGTLYGAAMQRNYRDTVAWYVFLSPGTPRTLGEAQSLIRRTPGRVRLLVADPAARWLVDDGSAGTVGGPRPPDGPAPDSGPVGGTARPLMRNIDAASYLMRVNPGKVECVLLDG